MVRRFSYEGDHEEVTLYGVTFPQGEPVSIDPQQHPVLLAKLHGNSHFREHDTGVVTADESPETVEVFISAAGAVHSNQVAGALPMAGPDTVVPIKRKPGRPRKES